MSRIDPAVTQAVKAKVNMVELVRRYVELRPSGSRMVGLCPFHNEKTPSFSVSQDPGLYYCFGCQASGDAIDFYCRINGLSFQDGVERLAAETGVELGDVAPETPEERERRRMSRLYKDMHALAAEHYLANLAGPAGKGCREYLDRRGVTPEIREKYGLGFSLDDFHGLHTFLRGKGLAEERGVEAGLLTGNDRGNIYDRFRGRLMFPIRDLSGQVIAFGGRIIEKKREDDPKYVNSSDSPIYKKGEHLYGLYEARGAIAKVRKAVVTEGYMDALSLRQFGWEHAVGVLGTALTESQVKRLSGFSQQVELVFDGDAAGRKAALRSAEMFLQAGLNCVVVTLPDGEDIDSLLKSGGPEAFKALEAKAEGGLDFCCREARALGGAREVVGWARNFLKGLKDSGWKAFYLPRLSAGLGLSEAELRRAGFDLVAPARHERQADRAEGETPQGPRPVEAGPVVAKPPRWRLEGTPGVEPVARSTLEHALMDLDRHVLRWLIARPERACELGMLEAREALTSAFCRGLWDKLAVAGEQGGDPLADLDANERSLYSRITFEDGSQDAGEPLDEAAWQRLTELLELRRADRRRAQLSTALDDDAACVEFMESLRRRCTDLSEDQ